MGLSEQDLRLIGALADGLPIESRPYRSIGAALGMSEVEVIGRIGRLLEQDTVRRLGVIVRHRALGYRANAMVVWDVPDDRVAAAGHALAGLPVVTLCYERPRRLPDWPYNLFCMIHGRARASVEAAIEQATVTAGLAGMPRAVLFSRRPFKQRGARYQPAAPAPVAGAA